MTPRERVFNRIQGKPVDRVPNLNIVMLFAAKFIGVPYDKYVTDFKYLVEGNIRCCEYFGIDMLSTISDPMREAAAFGADIIIPFGGVPYSEKAFIQAYSDIKKLVVKSPQTQERMLDRLKAVERYKMDAGELYPILGWVEGAFAEANDLRGMTELMVDVYDEPEAVKELLEICNEQAILFAREQIKAGADFIGIGDAAASLVSPDIYKEFVLPYEKRLISAIHTEGALAKLHICGNTSHLLGNMTLSGADMVDVDWMVDFRKAHERLNGNCSVCGNFDPVKILLEGTVEEVKNAVKGCIRAGTQKTFIAAGCEVPKFTSHENMLAMAEAIRDFSFNQP